MRDAIRELRRLTATTWRVAPFSATFAVLLGPVSVLGTVGLAVVQRGLIDTGAGDDITLTIFIVAGGALVFAVLITLGFMQFVLKQLAGHRMVPETRRELLRLIDRRREFEDLSTAAYADDIERLRRDVRPIVEIGWTVYWGVLEAVALGISAWLLVSVDWRLLVVVVGAVLSLVISSLAVRRVVDEEERLAVLRRQERRLHESSTFPNGVQEVLSYRAEQALDARATALWREVADRRMRVRSSATLRGGSSWFVLGAALVAGVAILASEIEQGSATVGDLVLLITLTLGLRGQLAGAVESLTDFAQAYPGLRALARVRAAAAEHEPDASDHIPAIRDGIAARNLSFRYVGSDRTALQDIDLDIPAGTVLAIVGQNGAGKSTLANLLLGILTPTSGSILADGRPVQDHGWRRSSSGAFQDYMKPRVALRDAVGIGEIRAADDDRVAAALASAGGSGLLESLPDGLDTSLSDRDGSNLSHGQWQIVALARSAMRPDPVLLVLDEPSSALDAHAEHELFTRFIEQGRAAGRERGTISVVISHRYSAAYLADLILVVERGQVIERGTHAELMAAGGEYQRTFEAQREAYR
jgi:ATP-binding cassette subfamily B protein